MTEHVGLVGFLVAAVAAVAATGCCAATGVPVTPSREVCLVRTEAASGLPRLYRRANAASLNLGAAALVCGVPRESRALADRCEDVDDLAALLGTGTACGPNGAEHQEVCPAYPAERLRKEAPLNSAPPCQGACENVQIAVHEASGTVTRVLFYDDPGCHSAADAACAGAEHRCYYRVLALTSELR